MHREKTLKWLYTPPYHEGLITYSEGSWDVGFGKGEEETVLIDDCGVVLLEFDGVRYARSDVDAYIDAAMRESARKDLT